VSNGSNQLHRDVLIKIFFVLVSEEKVLFPMIALENLGIEVRSVTHGSSKISWLRRSDLSVVGDCDELSVLYIIFLISGGSFESSNISDGETSSAEACEYYYYFGSPFLGPMPPALGS
jgi:hypothetical protein